MKTTKTIKATDLNKTLADTQNNPKYLHVLLEDFDAGVHPELGKIDIVCKGTILVEGSYPEQRAEVYREYRIWWPTEHTESFDIKARVTIPGDKVVVFKKVITTTYTQV